MSLGGSAVLSVAVRRDLTTLPASARPSYAHMSLLIKGPVKAYSIARGELKPLQHGEGRTPPLHGPHNTSPPPAVGSKRMTVASAL